MKQVVGWAFIKELEGMARYTGQLIAPAEDFALQPKIVCPSGRKRFIMLFGLILGYFRCSVGTLVTFSSNLNNFERKRKKIMRYKKKYL